MKACILSGAALFALGMAFHEYLRPIARREPRSQFELEYDFLKHGWTPPTPEWVKAYGRMVMQKPYPAPLLEGDDWATDPRTAELATGGGR